MRSMVAVFVAGSIAVLSGCRTDLAGVSCRSSSDCPKGAGGAPVSWCDEGVCVACEPAGTPCDGPPDAAAPGADAAGRSRADAAVADVGAETRDGGAIGVDGAVAPEDGGPGADTGADAGGVDALDASPGSDASLGRDAARSDAAAPPDSGCSPGATSVCASVGGCSGGVSYCVNGVWGPCLGETAPSLETCDGVDNDCDGLIDEDIPPLPCGVGTCRGAGTALCSGGHFGACPIAPTLNVEGCAALDADDDNCNGIVNGPDECGAAGSCVYVTPNGVSGAPGTRAQPLGSINEALTAAASRGVAVCVASQASCLATPVPFNEAVVMKPGVLLLGGFESTNWERPPGCRTVIQPPATAAAGVSFGSFKLATQITGFDIHAPEADYAPAVRIQGAQASEAAVVFDNRIFGSSQPNSIGVLVEGGEARIEYNAIEGGTGSASAIGVKVVQANPIIRRNCDAFGASGCTGQADAPGATRYIRGRSKGKVPVASAVGIRLERADFSVVSENAIHAGGAGQQAFGIELAQSASDVTIALNDIRATLDGLVPANPVNYAGIWGVCASSSPWIVGNHLIGADAQCAGCTAAGIRSVGTCKLRIDANGTIAGALAGTGPNAESYGVACQRDTASNACVVTGNEKILGALSGTSNGAVGVLCGIGSCQTIQGNAFVGGGTGQYTTGVSLQKDSHPLVDRNVIAAGCATTWATGVHSTDSYARLQNNVLQGGTCSGGDTLRLAWSASGTAELDLHSNTLFGVDAADGTVCHSRTIYFETPAGQPRRGLFRNNVVIAGRCPSPNNFLVLEASGVGPRAVWNNFFWGSTGFAYVVYYNGAAADLVDLNALGGSNQLSDPHFAAPGDFHLADLSPCIDTGTSQQAPATDFDRDPRPRGSSGLHDIGADEK